VPREEDLKALLAHFDWGGRSRLVEDGASKLAGAVLVTSRQMTDGIVARVDPAADGEGSETAMRDLVLWSLNLSRAAGAAAVQVWVGPGHGNTLRSVGLDFARPWWRMDRRLADLPKAVSVPGYELSDGWQMPKGSWADMHNRSFADHWRFSPRSEDELMMAKTPQLCLMAITAKDRQPAAVTLCHVETYADDSRPQPVGLVSSVGTLPEHRRRGLATWLVSEALRRLRSAGARHASLYVDGLSQTRAFDAYRKLGFELAFEAEVWEATSP
jgi:ribosomal protein S18 acetylase RimI-like enzyme